MHVSSGLCGGLGKSCLASQICFPFPKKTLVQGYLCHSLGLVELLSEQAPLGLDASSCMRRMLQPLGVQRVFTLVYETVKVPSRTCTEWLNFALVIDFWRSVAQSLMEFGEGCFAGEVGCSTAQCPVSLASSGQPVCDKDGGFEFLSQ